MATKKSTKGRPAYVPTDKDRAQVKRLSAIGIPQEEIAVLIGISEPTLRKHFKEEIATGLLTAKATVASRLFELATDKKKPCIPAIIFWLKCQGHWSDRATSVEMGKKEIAQAEAEAMQEKSIYGTLDSKLKRVK